jgi:hypothetical protein
MRARFVRDDAETIESNVGKVIGERVEEVKMRRVRTDGHGSAVMEQ